MTPETFKTLFITGVSRGIGLATANPFLDNGYEVIGTSTSGKSPLENEKFTVLKLDLSSPESIKSVAENIISQGRRFDIFINNAGSVFDKRGEAVIEIESLRKTLEVNLIGTIDMTERLLPSINNGGHILNPTFNLQMQPVDKNF